MTEFVSKGAVHRIKSGDCSFQPVLQIINITQMKGDGNGVRYKFLLTDGVDKIHSMPATQLNTSIMEGKIDLFSIIKITNFQTSNVNGHPIVIILAYDVMNRLNYDISGTTAPTQQTSAPVAHTNTSLYHPSYGATSASQSLPAPANPVLNPPNPYSAAANSAPSYGATASNPYQANAPVQANQSLNQSRPNPFPPAQPVQNPYTSYGSSNSAGSRPVVKHDGPLNIVPISAINPYSSKWTIKARITAKSEIRKWSNARGEGTLFSIDLLDSAGGEIKGTFFKEACDKYFSILEEGKVYTFSGGTLKVVQNRQYSSLKNNYEITFNMNSEILPAQDDAGIKSQNFNFVRIDSIAMLEANATIDVIALVRDATEASEIISTKQGGRTLIKRDLTLIDDSGSEIKLTLWGDKASTPYDWRSNPIVAFKNVRVGDYGGKSLSAISSTSLMLNPDIPEGHKLHSWRVGFGGALPVGSSLSAGGVATGGGLDAFDHRKNIAAIKDEQLGFQDKPDYITLKGTVVYIKHDTEPFYTACPTPGCNKKVTETLNGEYMCEKCNKLFQTCSRRYVLSINMADHSGSNWFTLFNDTADILLKHNAEDLHQMKSTGQEDAYEKVFSDALFKTLVGKARVKQEMVQEERRVKSSFVKVEEIDYISECRSMIDAINRYQ